MFNREVFPDDPLGTVRHNPRDPRQMRVKIDQGGSRPSEYWTVVDTTWWTEDIGDHWVKVCGNQPRPSYRFHSLTTYSYRDPLGNETRCHLNVMPISAHDLGVVEIEMTAGDLARMISEAQQALGKLGP
jgi:hypothetical protein